MINPRCLFLSAISLVLCAPAAPCAEEIFKVFILAGQSNMEGKATNELFDSQMADPKTAEHFTHLSDGDEWITRDDVFVKFLDRKGPLTLGFGSPGRTGVELEFGMAMGDHYDVPVLLIKTAWGGHSLFRNFRPPSAGFPADEKLEKELADARKRVEQDNEKHKRSNPPPTLDDIKAAYGKSYRDMIAEVQTTLDNAGDLFPALDGREPDLAGFVWFQGWNDMYGAENEYAANLRHLINDVRRDLKTPELPVVVGVMGQNGSKPATGAMAVVKEAQTSVPKEAEFADNTVTVQTDVLVDKAAEALFPDWQKHFEEWKKVGSDRGYHYYGSAIWHLRIGRAFAEAMLDLQE